MRVRAGLLPALILGSTLFAVAILLAVGREAQAGRQSPSGVLSASNGGDRPQRAESPAQLTQTVNLPIVLKSCLPDPPGESDNIDDALTVCSGQTVSGQVGDHNLDDVYKIQAAAGQQLTILMNGLGGDADLYVYPPDATDINDGNYDYISASIDSNDEYIQETVPEGGFWYINVNSFDGTTDYNVTVTLSAP